MALSVSQGTVTGMHGSYGGWMLGWPQGMSEDLRTKTSASPVGIAPVSWGPRTPLCGSLLGSKDPWENLFTSIWGMLTYGFNISLCVLFQPLISHPYLPTVAFISSMITFVFSGFPLPIPYHVHLLLSTISLLSFLFPFPVHVGSCAIFIISSFGSSVSVVPWEENRLGGLSNMLS